MQMYVLNPGLRFHPYIQTFSVHFSSCFRREGNLDVEVAASGFTKDLAETFDQVSIFKICIYASSVENVFVSIPYLLVSTTQS